MKKLLSFIIVLFCILQVSFTEAPELKNMMPNSWQKLTRLSGQEEKSFFEKTEVKTAVFSIDDDFFTKTKIEDKYYHVFTETNCGIQFYRFLISDSPLEEGYTREYKNKTLTEEECIQMQGEKECIWQIVFLKNKKNELQRILIRPYALYWVSQGEWEGYEFNDLMIKPLNKNEIGFFITEIKIAFTANREKMKQNIVPIHYRTCKNQIDASNNIDFAKYKIKENIVSAWSKDGVSIQASACLFDSKCPFKYSIQNAFDGNPATSYVENTEDDLMKIDVWLGKAVDKMAIINGYAASEELYKANNRIKQVSNYFNLNDDCLSYQYIPCRGTNVSFTANYKGLNFNDTCIAEVNYLLKNKWVFGDINE